MRASTVVITSALGALPFVLPQPVHATVPEADGLDPVVVRDHCFAGEMQERQRRRGGANLSGGGGYGAAAPPPSPPATATRGGGRPKKEASGAGGLTFDVKTVEFSGATADQAPASSGDVDALQQLGYADPGLVPGEPIPGPRPKPTRRPTGPAVEYGGVVHLSNDDSLSLASAQRVLWAAERGAPIPLEHIRPHELLNYFTFDAVTPTRGQTFAVRASAVADGDEVALALAVKAANPDRAPVDLTLLVDRSGSMRSEGRMEYTQRALRRAGEQLRAGDRVNLVVFDSTVCTPLENFVVGRDDPGILKGIIRRIQPRGSTDMNAGLQTAYGLATAQAQREDARAGRVMVFTDAQLNTGVVDRHVVTEVGRALDEHGIRMTGVGVGTDFRDDVLDMLTEKGRGAYVFLGSERVVDRLFGSGFDALVHTVAEDVRFALKLPNTLGLTKFYGEESSRDPAEVTPVHVHAGSSQLFLQDLAVRPGANPRLDTVTLAATWTDPTTGRQEGANFPVRMADALRADPHDVHKAQALMSWTDALYAQAMGASPCGERDAFVDAWSHVQDDAEVAYVAALYGKQCDVTSPPVASVPVKVRVDSDVDVGEVALACRGGTDRADLRPGESVVSLGGHAGTCQLTLHGAVPMVAAIDVPATPVTVDCTSRGGRLVCR